MAEKITVARVGEFMKAVLTELQQAGGEARVKDLLDRAEPQLHLSDYERAIYAKSNNIRWRATVYFYSIDCARAGYIQKSGGKWHLTPAGEAALKLPAEELIRTAMEKYRAWKKAKPSVSAPADGEDIETAEQPEQIVRQSIYEQAVDQARTEIEDHIRGLGAYDFQKLVAELLIAMGYYVPYIAPPGPDGGIDIVAYKDPLGTSAPRIRVQVKHREQKMTVQEVRALIGLLKEGDMGLVVSSGGFTADAGQTIRNSPKHMEAMDLDRLITLWEEHYERIRQPGKTLLPLVRLHFLAPTEE